MTLSPNSGSNLLHLYILSSNPIFGGTRWQSYREYIYELNLWIETPREKILGKYQVVGSVVDGEVDQVRGKKESHHCNFPIPSRKPRIFERGVILLTSIALWWLSCLVIYHMGDSEEYGQPHLKGELVWKHCPRHKCPMSSTYLSWELSLE